MLLCYNLSTPPLQKKKKKNHLLSLQYFLFLFFKKVEYLSLWVLLLFFFSLSFLFRAYLVLLALRLIESNKAEF